MLHSTQTVLKLMQLKRQTPQQEERFPLDPPTSCPPPAANEEPSQLSSLPPFLRRSKPLSSVLQICLWCASLLVVNCNSLLFLNKLILQVKKKKRHTNTHCHIVLEPGLHPQKCTLTLLPMHSTYLFFIYLTFSFSF